ncbi:LuxR C-terminal-related transcriptional regulator [Crystallibacter degradans]|uniref:LuxR C-terminal-related transcriptional regulator n=1 Tax=Crystallibacter degradans TaxID=2726743 RepID=UPI001474C679|nr:LuxR C-terminal-related transcriptional regulator [Arthrobacter sp. SF27]NMR28240.1 AAA family ATPase [Arthrobacter sp. SF27]
MSHSIISAHAGALAEAGHNGETAPGEALTGETVFGESPPISTTAVPRLPASAELPALAGRGRATAAVTAILNSKTVRGALIIGAPGIGKTALLGHIAQVLRPDFRFIRLAGSAASLLDVPFAALGPLLGDEVPPAPDTPPVEVLRATLRFLSGRAEPPVLLVDDAHELDPVSAVILAQLIGTGAVKALLAARPGNSVDPELAALQQDGQLERCELAPLTVPEVHDVVRHVLGGPVLPAATRLLSRNSVGHPRNLLALLEESRRLNRLVEHNGNWLPTGRFPETSELLQDMLREDLQRLATAEQEAVYAVALAGPLRLRLLSRLARGGHFERLQAGRLLEFDFEETDQNRDPDSDQQDYTQNQHQAHRQDRAAAAEALAHFGPLVRLGPAYPAAAVRSIAPAGTRRELYGRFTQILVDEPELTPDSVGPARWALDAQLPLSEKTLLATAQQANRGHDLALALRAATVIESPQLAPAAEVEIIRIYLRQGYAGRALARLSKVLANSTDPAVLRDAVLLGQEVVVRTGAGAELLSQLLRNWDIALTRRILKPEDRRFDRLLHHHAMQLEGRFAESIPGLWRLAAEADAAQQYEGRQDPATEHVVLVAKTLLAEAALATGDRQTSADIASAVLRLLEDEPDTGNVLQEGLALRLIRCLVQASHLTDATGHLERYDTDRPESLVVFGGTTEFLHGWVELKQGRVRASLDRLLLAVDSLRMQDPHQLLGYSLGLAADAAAMLNERGTVASCTSAFSEHRAHHRGTIREAMPLTAQARIAAAGAATQGMTAAVQELTGLAARLAQLGRVTEETEVHILLLRLGELDGLARLRDITAAPAGRENGLLHAFAQALLDKNADRILVLARDAADAGYPLLAAEAAAYGARYLAREGQHDGHRDGHRARQRKALRLVHQLRLQLPDVVTSQLGEPFVTRELTYRERDVVTLVAQGMRSRDIAARLGVSVRTVDGHIYRIYDKLHVRTRAELAAVVLSGTQQVEPRALAPRDSVPVLQVGGG